MRGVLNVAISATLNRGTRSDEAALLSPVNVISSASATRILEFYFLVKKFSPLYSSQELRYRPNRGDEPVHLVHVNLRRVEFAGAIQEGDEKQEKQSVEAPSMRKATDAVLEPPIAFDAWAFVI